MHPNVLKQPTNKGHLGYTCCLHTSIIEAIANRRYYGTSYKVTSGPQFSLAYSFANAVKSIYIYIYIQQLIFCCQVSSASLLLDFGSMVCNGAKQQFMC